MLRLLQVRLHHPAVQVDAIDAILCELSTTLLDSHLAADLRRLCPTELFDLSYPVCEGELSPIETRFRLLFDTTTVTRQCDGVMYSAEMGRIKDDRRDVEIGKALKGDMDNYLCRL